MSIHELLRELWDADEGGPLEFAKAGFTFLVLILALFAWAIILSAMLP